MSRVFRLNLAATVAAAAALVITGACKKNPTSPATTTTLLSSAAFDGFVGSNGAAVSAGGSPVTGDGDAVLPGVGFRQFFSFDLSSIPNNATIESANLQLFQAQVQGTPYGSLGNVIVDRTDLGIALDAADYSGGTLTSNLGTLSTTTTIEYKNLDVTNAVKADKTANKPRAEFRIRWSTSDSNNNGVTDRAVFTDAEDSCCSVSRPPQLVVTYRTSS